MPARRLLGFGLAAVLAAPPGPTPEVQPPTRWWPQVLTLEGDLSPIHDPAIIREGRTYHLFASNRFADRLVPMFCSPDRKRWTICGNVIEGTEAWRGPGHELLHVQHARAHAPRLQLGRRSRLRGLPRACAPERRPRHHEPCRRHDHLLRAARVRLLEALQPALRLVLVLHGHGGRAVNGERQEASAPPSSYWTVERTWKTGDRVDVSLPMGLHVHPMPDDPSVQAFMYGPLVLAGPLGNEGLTYEMMYADPVNARRGEGMRGQPVPAPELVARSADPADWIRAVRDPSIDRRDVEVVAGSPGDWTRAVDGGIAFHITRQARPLSLVPLNRVFGQRFAVYWQVKQA